MGHNKYAILYSWRGTRGWLTLRFFAFNSDILHPNRPNISKDELRDKLAGLYKAGKDQVSVFGLRTQFGGGKTTGFALIYDSPEAMKKFEPHYRLVRVGLAKKIEKASRQQRTYTPNPVIIVVGTSQTTEGHELGRRATASTATTEGRYTNYDFTLNRQAAQEPTEDPARYGEGQGCQGQEGEISDSPISLRFRIVDSAVTSLLLLLANSEALLRRFSSWVLVGHCEGYSFGFWLAGDSFIKREASAEQAAERAHTYHQKMLHIFMILQFFRQSR